MALEIPVRRVYKYLSMRSADRVLLKAMTLNLGVILHSFGPHLQLTNGSPMHGGHGGAHEVFLHQ